MNITLFKQIIEPIIIILIGLIVYLTLKNMLNKIFSVRSKKYQNNRYNTLESLLRNIIKYFIIIVCSIMILDIFGVDTKSIITSLGVVGVVTGLAMQDLLKDFVAGMGIVLENQYAIGDIVTIDDFRGTVTSFTLKTTRIKAWTGEEKIIANHLVTSIINHTHNDSIAIVDVGIAYDEDNERVEKVLNKVCDRLTKELPNLKGEVKVLGIEDLASSSVVYRISAEVKAGEQYVTQREIRKRVKMELDKEKISIPFNQLVIHNG